MEDCCNVDEINENFHILEAKKIQKNSVGLENTCKFYTSQIQKLFDELKIEFEFRGKIFTDEEVLKRKEEIPLCIKKLEQESNLVKNLHEMNNSTAEANNEIEEVMVEYEKTYVRKNAYIKFINLEESTNHK